MKFFLVYLVLLILITTLVLFSMIHRTTSRYTPNCSTIHLTPEQVQDMVISREWNVRVVDLICD
jgi:hypothetical protein